jgi:large subunit ribosomal protein L44e
MMYPKTVRRFCPSCKKHAEFDVKREKVGRKRREDAAGQRRFNRKLKGFGSFPRPNPKDRQKPTRKVDLRFKCKDCKKIQVMGKGFRVKKFEIIKKQK